MDEPEAFGKQFALFFLVEEWHNLSHLFPNMTLKEAAEKILSQKDDEKETR